MCQTLAIAITADSPLIEQVVEEARRQVESFTNSNPEQIQRLEQRIQTLSRHSRRLQEDPGTTEEDQAEARAILSQVRAKRASLRAELVRLTRLQFAPSVLPEASELRAGLSAMAMMLQRVATEGPGCDSASVRQIIELLTGRKNRPRADG